MTSALFWDITQRRVVIPYRRFRTTFLDFLILEDVTDRLFRNVGKELPLYVAQYPGKRRYQAASSWIMRTLCHNTVSNVGC